MYSRITVPERAIRKCIELNRRKPIIKFPFKKTLAIAACIAFLVTAIAVPVVAYRSYRAYDELKTYENTLPYSSKLGEGYDKISENSISLSQANKIKCIEGLTLTAQEVFYDGEVIYISFAGEYDGKFEQVERFVYQYDGFASFQVDGNSVIPYTNHEFYVMKTENGFAGVLGLPYSSDKESVNVKIRMPYLNVYAQDEIVGTIDGDFSFDLEVKKTCDNTLSYVGTGTKDDIYIQSITSATSGMKLVFYVPSSIEESDANIVPLVTDETGKNINFIGGSREITESGMLHIVRFESTDAKKINVYLIDKNNVDKCNKEICVCVEFEDIVLTK